MITVYTIKVFYVLHLLFGEDSSFHLNLMSWQYIQDYSQFYCYILSCPFQDGSAM